MKSVSGYCVRQRRLLSNTVTNMGNNRGAQGGLWCPSFDKWKTVQMELDTGATVLVISESEWNQLFPDTKDLKLYTDKPLRGYSGHQLDITGQGGI